LSRNRGPDCKSRKTRIKIAYLSEQAWNFDPGDETFPKHFRSRAERLLAVDGTPFGDFPAERSQSQEEKK
jgi:hypothetical protein